jgi:hypothetical protein
MNEVLSILLLFDWLNPFKTIAPETKHFHNVLRSNNYTVTQRIECDVDNCEILYYVIRHVPQSSQNGQMFSLSIMSEKMEPVMKPKN